MAVYFSRKPLDFSQWYFGVEIDELLNKALPKAVSSALMETFVNGDDGPNLAISTRKGNPVIAAYLPLGEGFEFCMPLTEALNKYTSGIGEMWSEDESLKLAEILDNSAAKIREKCRK